MLMFVDGMGAPVNLSLRFSINGLFATIKRQFSSAQVVFLRSIHVTGY